MPAAAKVSRTIRGTSCLAPAPMAWPTRIAPALASAKAGMKATELSWNTAMIAASTVVPSPATTTLMKKLKAKNSKNQLKPDGIPKRSIRRSSRRCSRGTIRPSSFPSRRNTTSSQANPTGSRPCW